MVHKVDHLDIKQYLQDTSLSFKQFTPPRKAGPYKILHYFYTQRINVMDFRHISNFIFLVKKNDISQYKT